MALLLANIIPFGACYIMAGYFFPKMEKKYSPIVYRLLFAVAMFFGLTSCSFYLGRLIYGEIKFYFPILEFVLFCLILGIFKFLTTRANQSQLEYTRQPVASSSKWQGHLKLAFIALLLLTLIQSLLAYWVAPHGWWDAWAIWNLRARFLFLGGENWLSAFSNGIPHPDYPLLVPATVARLWHYLGNHSTLVPAINAMVFCLSTIGLLTTLLTTLRGKTVGLLAGVVLMGTYKFIEVSTYQIADVPLAFYFLATVSALCLFHRFGLVRHIVLAGMMAGFAVWTKNEGLLFVIICIFSYALISIPQKNLVQVGRELSFFIAGLLPIVIIVLLFKLNHAPANDLFSQLETKVILGYITDPHRYVTIAIEVAENMSKVAKVWLVILPVAMIVLLRKNRSLRKTFYFKISVAITLFMIFGYLAVYLITPHDLQWHLDTSMWRLIIHVWPIMLFLYFLQLPMSALETQ